MKEAVGAFLVVVGLIAFTLWLVNEASVRTDRDCKAKFGQEWEGRYSSYSGTRCVNDKGEAKYL